MSLPTKILPASPNATNPPLLIKDLLTAGVRLAGKNEIVYRDLQRFSYADFFSRVQQLANLLTSQGVKAGDVVAVLDWDSHRYLECFFAIPMLGAVLHTVNVRLAPEQILYTMQHAEDVFVLTNEEFLPVLEPLAKDLPLVKGYLVCQDQPAEISSSLPLVGEYEELLAKQPTSYEFASFDENSVATLFYTTGTTGNPKGVFFTHRQLVLHTLIEATFLQAPGSDFLSRDKVYMPITPMFHVHAWGMPFTATFLGATQVYPGKYEPEMLVKLLITEKVDFSHCVPTLLNMVVSAPAVTSGKVNLKGWKLIIGGSALPQGLAKKAWDLGIDVRAAYGMSETCPIVTVAILPKEIEAADFATQLPWRCKTGVPVGLVDVEIVDPDGNPVPADGKSVGEIRVKAPWLTQAYYKEPERSEELWRDGWLYTGDVATQDEHGYLQITDRVKDVIKTGGEWVSSLDLENMMSQVAGVAEVAVVGVADERWGERPVALVVASDPANPPQIEAIKAHLNTFVEAGKINRWAIPETINLVDEIPKTSVGKLNKKLIRQNLE